jgi:hypothetical protein
MAAGLAFAVSASAAGIGAMTDTNKATAWGVTTTATVKKAATITGKALASKQTGFRDAANMSAQGGLGAIISANVHKAVFREVTARAPALMSVSTGITQNATIVRMSLVAANIDNGYSGATYIAISGDAKVDETMLAARAVAGSSGFPYSVG